MSGSSETSGATSVDSADIAALTAALVEANDQLLALYDLAHVTSNTLGEREAVAEVLQRAAHILAADAMLLTSAGDVFGIGSPLDRGHLTSAGSESAEHLTSNPHITAVAATHASGLDAELRVLRRRSPFTTGDRKMLSAVLRTALGAISTARLHQQVLRRALDNQDQQRAAEIAQLALPGWRPELHDTDFFVANEPARETGGDLYCYALEGDELTFAVGDVSGKGLTAAVMMTTAICAANATFRDPRSTDPAHHVAIISQWMFEHLSAAGLFITLFVGHYRASDGVLTWANAGHSPCLIQRGNEWTELPAQTPPIGVLADVAPETQRLRMSAGDVLAIGSDGLVEQEDGDGQPFGDARFRLHLSSDPKRPLASVGASVLSAIDGFAGDHPRLDDRTLLLLRRQT